MISSAGRRQKKKKPSQSRHIFTRLLYFGGFDYQSRRFFLSI